jgi:hypothetical protein
MVKTEPARWTVVSVSVVACLLVSAPAAAQAPASAPLAAQLAELMSGAQLDAVAGRSGEGEDHFVAALAFPGQLLVVSARYEVPLYVEQKIADGEYREVYIDLNAASIPQTKVLITDTGADGLSSGDDSADMVDTGSGPARYDGDADADAQYARMLRALIAEAR